MLELRLMGGLGNQMSQVAFGYYISRLTNQKLYIDVTSYKHYKRRPCSINRMKLCENIIVGENAGSLFHIKSRLFQKIFHVFNHMFYKGKEMPEKFFYMCVKSGHVYSFDSKYYPISRIKKNSDIYGYFLIEKYFRKYYKEICELFHVKDEELSEASRYYERLILESDEPIAISLRLQDDYVKDDTMYVCTKEYYQQGIEYLKENHPNGQYFIFADDIERAKKMNLGVQAVYIEGMTDVEGMHLMSKCHHFLISNSSFSWWGAYLSQKERKQIVVPDHWINNAKDYSDKYYEGMIKIEC